MSDEQQPRTSAPPKTAEEKARGAEKLDEMDKAIKHLINSLKSRETLAHEQRDAERFPMHIQVEVCLKQGDKMIHKADAWGIDASRGGLGLLVRAQMDLWERAYVRIHLSRLHDCFFPIRVMYCRRLQDDLFLLGCAFLLGEDQASDSGLLLQ